MNVWTKILFRLVMKGLLFFPLECAEKKSIDIIASDRLYAEGHYLDAIPLYEKLIQLTPDTPALNLRLGGCYLEMNQPAKTIALLTRKTFNSSIEESERIYLVCLSYRRVEDYKSSLAFLNLMKDLNIAPEWQNQIALEKGIALFHLKDFKEAERHLESIEFDEGNPETYSLSRIYLSHLKFNNGKIQEARQVLTELETTLSNQPDFYYEINYIMGLCYFAEEAYESAIIYFEKSLPLHNNPLDDSWVVSALDSIIECGIKLLQEGLSEQMKDSFCKVHLAINRLLNLETNKEKTYFLNQLDLKILSRLSMFQKQWDKADALLEGLPQDSEILSMRAEIAMGKGDLAKRKEYLQTIYLTDPESPYSAPAYFHSYSYRDYVRGQRTAIKHLQRMPSLYKNHPLSISAYYLMGLDYKKNHLSEEGQIIRRKDLITSIENFQQAELLFEKLSADASIPPKDLQYYLETSYRSMLERALTNLMVAEESEGGKRKIYYVYAEEIFKTLIKKFQDPISGYPKILEEAHYGLSQNYKGKNKSVEAELTLCQMLRHYEQAGISQSYLLSRVWYDLGSLAKVQGQVELALFRFHQAEKASGLFLSPDEKLDVWIQQSLCYKTLNQLDESMRLLSKVVNDETVSNLRIKAMYLRAQLYALEGRKELALKQLKATSKKGGEWGKKAKEELLINYGN